MSLENTNLAKLCVVPALQTLRKTLANLAVKFFNLQLPET
jgi:hypothetical protein